MRKSKEIALSMVMFLAIASCQQQEQEWVNGYDSPKSKRDTVVRDNKGTGHVYRYYNGSWYPVYHNMIRPGYYSGATSSEISRPSYTPVHMSSSHSSFSGGSGFHSGGFGGSAHFSAGS